jgi:general secretion pathway protein H
MAPTAYRAVRAMTPISSSNRQCARGFTLLELLVVLSIIAIATGLIAPNLRITDNAAFNAEVRHAASALTYARRMAIVKGAPQTTTLFALDPRASDYDDLLAEAEAVDEAARWTAEGLELSYEDELGGRPEQVDQFTVTFFPQGGSTGGLLRFTRDERSAQIRVDPITGHIDTAYNGEELDEAQ